MSMLDPLSYRAPLVDYQRQAEKLLDTVRAGDEDAQRRIKWLHPRFRGKSVTDVKAATLDIADARVVVAQEHGFASWTALEEFTVAVNRDMHHHEYARVKLSPGEGRSPSRPCGDLARIRRGIRRTWLEVAISHTHGAGLRLP